MGILRLDVEDFRNLASVKMEPNPLGFNLLYGANGSGKTSLLESIYYLGLGRSFRSTLAQRVMRNSASKFSIFAQIKTCLNASIPVGMERQLDGSMKIRIAGDDVQSVSEL